MTTDEVNWDEYYQKIQGRKPRQLLLDALEKFQAPLHAIDLGCGDGTETVVLLERGWQVLAVDGEPAAIKRLLGKVSAEHQARLQTQVAKFKDVVLSPADLIHASLSIPFCEPEYFDVLWQKIINAIKPGGRFAGQFFGVKDSWAVNTDMTFHTEDQVRARFVDFEIESFHEMDEDGTATSGPKHWHMFTVIARKIWFRASSHATRHCEPVGQSNLSHSIGDCFVGLRPPRNNGKLQFLFIKPITFIDLCPHVMSNVPGIGVVFTCQR